MSWRCQRFDVHTDRVEDQWYGKADIATNLAICPEELASKPGQWTLEEWNVVFGGGRGTRQIAGQNEHKTFQHSEHLLILNAP